MSPNDLKYISLWVRVEGLPPPPTPIPPVAEPWRAGKHCSETNSFLTAMLWRPKFKIVYYWSSCHEIMKLKMKDYDRWPQTSSPNNHLRGKKIIFITFTMNDVPVFQHLAQTSSYKHIKVCFFKSIVHQVIEITLFFW